MIDNNYPLHNPSHRTSARQSIKAVLMKNFRVIYQPAHLFEKWRMRLIQQGLAVNETEHFLFAIHPDTGITTLLHSFDQYSIDNNVGYYLMKELAPYGIMKSENAFGATLVGVVTSIKPDDPVTAWGMYSLNTFHRLQALLHCPSSLADEQDFITPFAHIYQRLLELQTGTTLLDVGCACAFWPLLATTSKKLERIVGVDNRLDAINLSQQLARLADINNTDFTLADVLSPRFYELGKFDTVTAIHLIEHIQPSLLPIVLNNLLQVTRHRLLIAVPYEKEPEQAYGHEHVFNHEILEQWGQWCISQVNGRGRAYCEDIYGGLLIIECF